MSSDYINPAYWIRRFINSDAALLADSQGIPRDHLSLVFIEAEVVAVRVGDTEGISLLTNADGTHRTYTTKQVDDWIAFDVAQCLLAGR